MYGANTATKKTTKNNNNGNQFRTTTGNDHSRYKFNTDAAKKLSNNSIGTRIR